VNGAIALVGSGEFTPALESLDRELLAATGRSRPRVAIVPAIPSGNGALLRWAEIGRQHFTALGAEVEPVLVRSRADADDPAHAQAVGEADLVYLSGGHADFLCRTLAGSFLESTLWQALERGAVVAGCSAGASVLAAHRYGLRRRLGWPFGWQRGLGLVPGVAVAPDYDARPEVLRVLFILRAPPGTVVVGIDRHTALLGRGDTWQVQGQGRVTIWRGRRRSRHHDGDFIRLEADIPAVAEAV
jgi:cyanophycinase